MLKGLVITSIVAILAIAPLREPELEWVHCRCNDATLGLNEENYRLYEMWRVAVRESCFKGGEGLPLRSGDQGGIPSLSLGDP